MSVLGRYIVDAVVLERRSPTELAREHGISRRWIHKLVKRFNEDDYQAFCFVPPRGGPNVGGRGVSQGKDARAERLRSRIPTGSAGRNANQPEALGQGE